MYIPSEKYGRPNLGKDVCIVGEANFGSESYLVTIGDGSMLKLAQSFTLCFINFLFHRATTF